MSALTSIEKRILSYLKDQEVGATVTSQSLAKALNYGGTKMYKKLVRAINYLENIGELEQTKRGHYRLSGKVSKTVVGTYRANAQGFGFVTYAEGQPDFFVPRGRALNAMQGDTVEVEVLKLANPQTGKGSEVQVLRVIERAVNQLVGEFVAYPSEVRQERQALGYVLPQGDYSDAVRVEIDPAGIQPADHSICIVKISQYPTEEAPHLLRGLVAKEIGHRDEPGVDILSVLYQFGIPHEFPEVVKEAAEAVPQTLSAQDLANREDLRQEVILTIDGADAKDLDDAISLDRLENGDYVLGVHIADVSYYVEEGSALDLEAYQRGTSVYLTDRVVPMLPQRLSNGICSLHPHEDRLTLSCQMVIDSQGQVKSHRIFRSVIHSSYRMTYDDVNAILEGDEGLGQKYAPIVDLLEDMSKLHHLLEAKRIKRGALDFDAPEAKVLVDGQGHPLDIQLRERGVAERLIESFMLAANETVAKHYMTRDYPMLYRVHEQPDSERMQRFAEFITAFGIVLRGKVETIAPKQLQQALKQVDGQDFEQAVSTMMLRSMKQARYSEEALGHYGLATAEYTHFTSPIRRYPDLIVHRLIHRYLDKKPSHQDKARIFDQLPGIADQSSKMERRAIDAERDVTAMKKAEYMLDKIGQEFEGVISSVTSFGIFVALPNTVEGLISLKDLTGDYYEFDQAHLLLVGQRTGRIFRIGQKVKVRLEAVNVGEREIDFGLLEAEPVTGLDVDLVLQRSKQAKAANKSAKGKTQDRQRKDKSARASVKKKRVTKEDKASGNKAGASKSKGSKANKGRQEDKGKAKSKSASKRHRKELSEHQSKDSRQAKKQSFTGDKASKKSAKSTESKFKQFKIKRKQPQANRLG
jgi:ribonuclease R